MLSQGFSSLMVNVHTCNIINKEINSYAYSPEKFICVHMFLLWTKLKLTTLEYFGILSYCLSSLLCNVDKLIADIRRIRYKKVLQMSARNILSVEHEYECSLKQTFALRVNRNLMIKLQLSNS